MRTVDLSIEDDDPPDWLPDIHAITTRALDELSVENCQVGVYVCGDNRMAELNSEYRGAQGPTDVLTFSQSEGEEIPVVDGADTQSTSLMGDIVISSDTVAANASLLSISPREELARVLVHGILHLAGYEHTGVKLNETTARNHPMLGLQERIVEQISKEWNQ